MYAVGAEDEEDVDEGVLEWPSPVGAFIGGFGDDNPSRERSVGLLVCCSSKRIPPGSLRESLIRSINAKSGK